MLATASLELKAEKQGAHDNFVLSVAFSPDGKTIVSGSRDKPEKADDKSPRTPRDKAADKPGSPNLKVWDAGASRLIPLNTQPKTDHSPAYCSFLGAEGGEAERTQPLRDVPGLLARRHHHRVGLCRPDDQRVGCRCVGTDTPEPSAQN